MVIQLYIIQNCFEETERGILPVQQYYDDGHHHLPYGSPSLFAHDVRDSSGHRLGQPPLPPSQQHYWMMSSGSRSSHGSAEELDLELRL